jgi:hypothetical protein
MKKNYSTPHTRTTAIRTLRLMSGSPKGNATTTTNSNATIQLSEPRGNGNAANAASRGSSIWED